MLWNYITHLFSQVKIIRKHVKESRMLLNKSGIISVIEEESPPPPPKTVDKDPYNISNDEYYSTKTQESLIKVATGGGLLQHATPTVQLIAPFVPTHMGPVKLRSGLIFGHFWCLLPTSQCFGNVTDYHRCSKISRMTEFTLFYFRKVCLNFWEGLFQSYQTHTQRGERKGKEREL